MSEPQPIGPAPAPKPLEGLVAQILNDQELVINIGADDLVRKGMRFAVLAQEPLTITDPKTGAVIGELDRTKVNVEAVEVHDHITVCATYGTVTRGGGLSALAGTATLAEMFAPAETVPETFKATEWPAPLSEEESYVKTGDRVKQIVR
jgi:hypothetical protein